MLISTLQDMEESPFSLYKNLKYGKEINKLTKMTFEIPKDFRYLFQAECLITHDKETYEVKNIEPFYEGYKIEARQAVYTLQYNFLKSVNFHHKDFETIIKGILPHSWSYKIVGQIEGRRTMTADHIDSWEAIKLVVKKFDCEFKIHAEENLIIFGKELGEDKGMCFFDDLNIDDKDITEESFEFATRIIPEGMNGLKINQINNGKDYLEDKSYSWKTITYHWKDERYTNIQNLKDEASRKLETLSRPRITIKLKVQDLSDAIGLKGGEYDVGDYVYLIDRDRKTKERYRVVAGSFYPYKPFDNDLALANRPLDMVDDLDETIDLTKEMWEETRVRFETTEDSIKSSVSTAKRYTDASFKTYKAEREQTDSRIYESITESTTYVDPKTGQTKPIIDKQLEINKTIDGINVSLSEVEVDISNVQRNIRSLSADVKLTQYGLESKVSANEIISEINQTHEQVKIKASKIDFEGNVTVKGDFKTSPHGDSSYVHMFDNRIRWYDDRWSGYILGEINVTRTEGTDKEFSLNFGHYPTGTSMVSYYRNDTKLWHPYITFDKWGIKRYGSDRPIIVHENINMLSNTISLGKWDIISKGEELRIKPRDSNSGIIFNRNGLYAYYASGGRDVYKEIIKI